MFMFGFLHWSPALWVMLLTGKYLDNSAITGIYDHTSRVEEAVDGF